MSKFHKLLVVLGVVAIPAVALAAASRSTGSCCDPQSPCCERKAASNEQAAVDTEIVCPLTGATIRESACPLCQKQK